jgi:hypothetical protein
MPSPGALVEGKGAAYDFGGMGAQQGQGDRIAQQQRLVIQQLVCGASISGPQRGFTGSLILHMLHLAYRG